MVLSLSACGKNSIEWVYDKETADKLVTQYEKIAAIPRQTNSCDAISEYLVTSLEGLGLKPLSDKAGNVIADVPASTGLEALPLVILQSNMDMVCSPQPTSGHYYTVTVDENLSSVLTTDSMQSGETTSEAAVGNDNSTGSGIEADTVQTVEYDPLTDPIEILYDDGLLSADDTALGADSGMAISLILEYLSQSDAKHGPLRIIFTTDANDAFKGADALDSKYLSDAKYLINLCSKSSSILYNGSAGEREIEISKKEIASSELLYENGYAIRVFGLIGGDAADDLNRGRINAGDALIKILSGMQDMGIRYQLLNLYGGTSSDAIIADATAIIRLCDDDFDPMWAYIEEQIAGYEDEYINTDPGLECTISMAMEELPAISDQDLKSFLDYAQSVSNGAITGDASLNLGILSITAQGMYEKYMLYSSDADALDSAASDFVSNSGEYGFSGDIKEVSQVWASESDSSLIKQLSKAYKKLTGDEISIRQSSSGLECSCFKIKNSNLQLLSIGPDVWDCGTTEEFCNVESAVKILNLLESFLPEIN